MVNAAHPPAVVIRHDTDEPLILRQEGDVVGTFPDAEFSVTELTMEVGDRLFLFTDGLIETVGSHDEGLQKLVAACSSRERCHCAILCPR